MYIIPIRLNGSYNNINHINNSVKINIIPKINNYSLIIFIVFNNVDYIIILNAYKIKYFRFCRH